MTDPAADLAEVDEQLHQLREQVTRLVGQNLPADGVLEPEEGAADLTAIQETQALIDALETRRANLVRRLEEHK